MPLILNGSFYEHVYLSILVRARAPNIFILKGYHEQVNKNVNAQRVKF